MIFLAPLQGYTDFIFRNIYGRYYSGIDVAVSPFISLVHGEKGFPRIAKDVSPANNHGMQVIPQILGNDPAHFIKMAEFLYDWGYKQLNWNMGCPVKNVTRKKRGSGLLPYPELLREILDKIIPHIRQSLSVKIRLGLNNTNEINQIIPVLNDFPLEKIIIHPRIGIQMYEGVIYHDVLQNVLPLFKHEIVYNGDIFTLDDFKTTQKKYPSIQKWMIGRGVYYNPLLPSVIKGEQQHPPAKNNEMFLSFMLDLYKELQKFIIEKRVVFKVKDLWMLFSKRFADSEYVFDQISHVHSLKEIIRITKKIVEEEKMNNWLL
jgi:tRNA-dihydrouridine synthase B